jgi:apolipoprotein N-acyltransferase
MRLAVSSVALSWVGGLITAVGTVMSFHLAQEVWGGWIVLFLYGVVRLAELGSWRKAFYLTVAVGYGAYAPHLTFLWTIFGPAALVLWGVLAVWLGLFVLLARGVRRHWGPGAMVLLVPWLWLGTEYFRSELYYLRFSWLSAGYAFAAMPGVIGATGLGVCGTGLVLMGLAGWAAWLSWRRGMLVLLAGGMLSAGLGNLDFNPSREGRLLKVAGVQLEFPSVGEVTAALDEVVRQHPGVDLIVLSEYTFLGPLPDELLAWCQREGRYVVVGGQDPIDEKRYFNTAYVVGPAGEVVFRQVKSVPIQFFQDGEPAADRAVWESPWGKLGIAICYDLSYRRVIDELVEAGAEGLIVPVMDVAEWGLRQRELHGRVGPVRAAEYGVPIFRLCSSGISQVIDGDGRVLATGSYPGEREIVAGEMRLSGRGRVPWDAWLGPWGVMMVVVVVAMLGLAGWKRAMIERGWKG